MSTSIQPNAPFRADIVGSFLRPQAVKDARAAYVAGTLMPRGLRPSRTMPFAIWWTSKRPLACR